MSLRTRAALLTGAALVAVTSLGGSALAADQPLTWAVVSSPNAPLMDNDLNSVSCTSPTACTAVGYAEGHTAEGKTLIESWNGTAWSIVPSPDKNTYNYLNSVSCISATACTAVGESYGKQSEPKTLVESWNGTAWSIVPSPNPGPNLGVDYLEGVTCTSASACIAVGWYHKRYFHSIKTVVESWNGTAWSIVPSPNPGPASRLVSAYLQSVTCTSATTCTAVGSYQLKKGAGGTLVESWNGSTWSIVPSANVPSGGGALYGVQCASATACMAVGQYVDTANAVQVFAESWDGSTWSIVPVPNEGSAATDNYINGLTCTSATACFASGSYATSTTTGSTLLESWNGTVWSIVSTPNGGGSNSYNGFSGVSCGSATWCTTVGSYGVANRRGKTLIEAGTSTSETR